MHRIAVVIFSAAAWAGSIEQASIERTAPGEYRLEFVSKDAGTIEVFADASPFAIVAKKPVSKLKQSPAEIRVTGLTGRLYFHLKPHSGATRTFATRSLELEGAANFRDLGGYRTADGRWTRWGLVFRSNNLAG